MGKRKIDKSKKIENKNQRSVAFCKRKRGFLKKAIELSRLCDQKIFMVMYDPDKDRVIQYSSDKSFSFQGALETVKRIKKSENASHSYEYYTNEDYNKFELVDFRTLRYKSKEAAGGEDVSDLNFDLSEDEPHCRPHEDLDDRLAEEEDGFVAPLAIAKKTSLGKQKPDNTAQNQPSQNDASQGAPEQMRLGSGFASRKKCFSMQDLCDLNGLKERPKQVQKNMDECPQYLKKRIQKSIEKNTLHASLCPPNQVQEQSQLPQGIPQHCGTSEHKESMATKSCSFAKSPFSRVESMEHRTHTAIDLASLKNQLDLVNLLKKSSAASGRGLGLFEAGQGASHVSLWVHLQNHINQQMLQTFQDTRRESRFPPQPTFPGFNPSAQQDQRQIEPSQMNHDTAGNFSNVSNQPNYRDRGDYRLLSPLLSPLAGHSDYFRF